MNTCTITQGPITLTLPYRPNSLTWNYTLNVGQYDTVGGRVTQLLSVQITDMTLSGDAGTKSKLLDLGNKVQNIMQRQAKFEVPAKFYYPDQNWTFEVYLQSMPQIGWQVGTVTYPYQLTMLVDQEKASFDQKSLTTTTMNAELSKLQVGVGFNPTYAGLGATNNQDPNATSDQTVKRHQVTPTGIREPLSGPGYGKNYLQP